MNQIDPIQFQHAAGEATLPPFPSIGGANQLSALTGIAGQTLSVRLQNRQERSFTLTDEDAQPHLHFLPEEGNQMVEEAAVLAACETAFALHPCASSVLLSLPSVLSRNFVARGAQLLHDGRLRLAAGQFWQQADFWLKRAGSQAYPLHYMMTNGHRHPQRAPKPVGIVYARHIPWLNQTLSFRVAEIEQDLPHFHRWMNDPRVAHFWQEEGDLAKHRAYLEQMHNDPHTLALIGCADGQPFGYFEVYWAKENRIGPHYDVADFDRGWHVLIGEENVRGRPWVTAWLPSLMHYIFLDDVRTQRIVGEPRADHVQQINNLDRNGFAKIKEFDFPHKRAMLVSLLRERFFEERRLVPRDVPEPELSFRMFSSVVAQ